MNTAMLAPLLLSWLGPAPTPTTRPVDALSLMGTSAVLDARCIRLTPDAGWASGSAWSKATVDLSEPFSVEAQLRFGNKDELGADGIVFVLSDTPALGWRGEGLGVAGLQGSVGIEIDTYQNRHRGDPAADHLALVLNGVPYHAHDYGTPLALPNLEDGRLHSFEVNWDPKKDILTINLDRNHVASFSGQVLRNHLPEASRLHWGFTASTGRKTNAHDVCFR